MGDELPVVVMIFHSDIFETDLFVCLSRFCDIYIVDVFDVEACGGESTNKADFSENAYGVVQVNAVHFFGIFLVSFLCEVLFLSTFSSCRFV